MLKVCRAGGGKGTFVINNIEDYNKQLSFISTYMPHAETILTAMVHVSLSFLTTLLRFCGDGQCGKSVLVL